MAKQTYLIILKVHIVKSSLVIVYDKFLPLSYQSDRAVAHQGRGAFVTLSLKIVHVYYTITLHDVLLNTYLSLYSLTLRIRTCCSHQ